MLNLNQKRHIAYTLIAVFFVSIASASMASARDVDVTSPPEPGQATAETPNLIMTLDGNMTGPENESDQPNLYQTQDSPPAVDDNSTVVIAPYHEAGSAQENNLIATSTAPDMSALIAGCACSFAIAAAVAVLLLVHRRKARNP
jgi:hypothetical protein